LIKKKTRIDNKIRNNNPNVNPTPSPTSNRKKKENILKLPFFKKKEEKP